MPLIIKNSPALHHNPRCEDPVTGRPVFCDIEETSDEAMVACVIEVGAIVVAGVVDVVGVVVVVEVVLVVVVATPPIRESPKKMLTPPENATVIGDPPEMTMLEGPVT